MDVVERPVDLTTAGNGDQRTRARRCDRNELTQVLRRGVLMLGLAPHSLTRPDTTATVMGRKFKMTVIFDMQWDTLRRGESHKQAHMGLV